MECGEINSAPEMGRSFVLSEFFAKIYYNKMEEKNG